MAVKNIVKAITLNSLAASGFSNSYVLVTPASGIASPCFLLRLINNSSEDVAVSYDGVTDNDFIPKMTSVNINAQTNSQPQNQCALFPIGTQVWIKAADDMGTGQFSVAGYYQPVGGNS
jgi:hypothetical protein